MVGTGMGYTTTSHSTMGNLGATQWPPAACASPMNHAPPWACVHNLIATSSLSAASGLAVASSLGATSSLVTASISSSLSMASSQWAISIQMQLAANVLSAAHTPTDAHKAPEVCKQLVANEMLAAHICQQPMSCCQWPMSHY